MKPAAPNGHDLERFLFFRVRQGHWLPGGILDTNGHCKLWVIWIPWQQEEGNQTGGLWEKATGERRWQRQTLSPGGTSQVAAASRCRQSWALPALHRGSHRTLQCLFKYFQLRFKGSIIFVAGVRVHSACWPALWNESGLQQRDRQTESAVRLLFPPQQKNVARIDSDC